MGRMVPFNDTSRIYAEHSAEIDACVKQVCASGRWLLGEQTKKFAAAFAAYCGTEFCLPVANGTDALELVLRSVLPETEGPHEIITVANAGGYTSTACRLVGATPVYADIDPESLLISKSSMLECVSANTRAVVLTHLYGGAIDVPAMRKALQDAGHDHVTIIEDCAQAHGAKVNGKRVGSLGDLAAFSFYPTKNLGAFGDAGAIITNDSARYQALSQLHQYGWAKKYEIARPYARNTRMDEMQAAILNVLLPALDGWNDRRRAIYARYREAGQDLQFLDYRGGDYVGHLAIVQSDQRDAFLAHMKAQSVAVDIHYPILDCDQSAWSALPSRIGGDGKLTHSRASTQRIATLPCFPTMRDDEIETVCQALISWHKQRNAA